MIVVNMAKGALKMYNDMLSFELEQKRKILPVARKRDMQGLQR